MARGNVLVRSASPSDISGLITLTIDNGVVDHVGRRVRPGDAQILADRFASVLADPDRLVLVAVDEASDELVGLSVLFEEQVGILEPTPTLYISHLLVAPAFRKRGAGRALLCATVRHAEDRHIEHVVVGVQSAARDANRYLARRGFAPLVIRRMATTSTLRRSLGIADSIDRLALRRGRTRRAVLPSRLIDKGA
jgi:ribosomal protein S18 acetylase RimI-like enzyme